MYYLEKVDKILVKLYILTKKFKMTEATPEITL